jgi:hypothetical protein
MPGVKRTGRETQYGVGDSPPIDRRVTIIARTHEQNAKVGKELDPERWNEGATTKYTKYTKGDIQKRTQSFFGLTTQCYPPRMPFFRYSLLSCDSCFSWLNPTASFRVRDYLDAAAWLNPFSRTFRIPALVGAVKLPP